MVAADQYWGIFNLQGLVFMGLYLLGIVAALGAGWIFNKILKTTGIDNTGAVHRRQLNNSQYASVADNFIRCLELIGENVSTNFKNINLAFVPT